MNTTITLGNLLTLLTTLPTLLMLLKIYGDWRVMRERLNILWSDYESRVAEGLGRRSYDKNLAHKASDL
jgi:hypothetical protein